MSGWIGLLGLGLFGRSRSSNAVHSDGRAKNGAPVPHKILIVGGGVMGSSVAWNLSEQAKRRGRNVKITVVEAGLPGSSWGETRIARLSGYHDPFYLNLMRRSFVLWNKLQSEVDARGGAHSERLLLPCPIVQVGDMTKPRIKKLFDEAAEICRAQKIDHLDSDEVGVDAFVERVWKGLKLDPARHRAIMQGEAAVVMAAECVKALGDASVRNGVTWVNGASVGRVEKHADSGKYVAELEGGMKLPGCYDQVVLCSGAYTNKMLRSMELPLLPILASNEQWLYYEAYKSGKGDLNSGSQSKLYTVEGGMPILTEYCEPPGDSPADEKIAVATYCVPQPTTESYPGVKLGWHRGGDLLSNSSTFVVASGLLESATKLKPSCARNVPNTRKALHRERSDDLHLGMKSKCDSFVRQYLPGLRVQHDPRGAAYSRCLYTVHGLASDDFMVGEHPSRPGEVFVATGFAGEGFKFAAAIGEVTATMVLQSAAIDFSSSSAASATSWFGKPTVQQQAAGSSAEEEKGLFQAAKKRFSIADLVLDE